MGLFSKWLGKKEEPQQKPEIAMTVKISTPAENSIPEYQGDYAKTIFLWSQRKAGPIHVSNVYPQYIKYECGISEPFKYHKKLLAEGYFEEATLCELLASLKVVELKEILKELQLPVSGNKEVLIERVPTDLDDAIVKRYFPDQLYSLTQSGNDFLSEHNDYVMIHTHKNWMIDWHEYDLQHMSGRSFYDTVWGMLNKRVLDETYNFGRNAYLSMCELLEEEGKKAQALEMLLRVLYIDVSASEVTKRIPMYRAGLFTKKDLLADFDISVTIAPGIIDSVASYKEFYTDEMIDRIYEHELPIQICSKEEFFNMIRSIMNSSFNTEKEIAKLHTAYNKYINAL